MTPYSLEASFHNHFSFLLHQFGFSIVEESYNQVMGNAVIVFAKPPTCIEVVKDRGQILVKLGDERLGSREWIEFSKAVQFLSGIPGQVYCFPSDYNDETEDAQVSHVPALMQQHCTLLLSGEMTIMQLREAMKAQREQELREHFESFTVNSDSEGST